MMDVTKGIGHDIAQLGQYNVEKGLEFISTVHLGCLHNIIGYALDSRGKYDGIISKILPEQHKGHNQLGKQPVHLPVNRLRYDM